MLIYLKDTCLFINRFNSLDIIKLLKSYKINSHIFGVTDVIVNELRPGKAVAQAAAEKSEALIGVINTFEKNQSIKVYNVENAGNYKSNFEKIRKKYYGHLNDVNAIKKALKNKEITQAEFESRSYRYKDYGECSCIAVAMTSPQDIHIVSDDKGRIFLKPNINLFDKYKDSHGINVLDFHQWTSALEADTAAKSS